MSFLSNISSGRIRQPLFAIVYGVDTSGKTNLASQAPSPVFMDLEHGSSAVDVKRGNTPKNFKEVLAAIDELTTVNHSYETLVLETLDWLEPLIFSHVVESQGTGKISSIEDFGYGKGYVLALDQWRVFLSKLRTLREKRGMHIILIAHSIQKLFKDPQNQTEYERYQLKLNDKAAALLREAVDYVLFMNFEVNVFKDEKKKVRAFGEGQRLMYTERRPGFDAKARTALPFEIPISKENAWNDFYSEYVKDVQESPAQIIERIKGFADLMPLEALPKIEESIEAAKNDAPRLEQILSRVKSLANVS
jgi:hypothetical protein